jgi:lipase chaperone LimK
MERRARVWIVAAIVTTALVIAYLRLRPHPGAPRAEEEAPPADVRVERVDEDTRSSAPAVASVAARREVERPLAPSLRGTEPDGDLEVDARGAFVPTRSALRAFDYYLSAAGEETDDAIRAHVDAFARARLPPAEAARATQLFDGYVAYRASLAQRLAREIQPGDVRGALSLARDAQRAQFGADAERLFGWDDALAEATLDRDAVLTNPSLDERTREARLDAIEARLPDAMRAARAERWAVERASRAAPR